MITPPRLEQALKKLYSAFYNGTLNPECCNHCAVGNICDNRDTWKNLTDTHGSLHLNYVGKVNEVFGKKINGYLPSELLKIEYEFLNGCGYSLPLHHKGSKPKSKADNDILFNGLAATISYLCELEGVKNVMDYTNLIENENSRSGYLNTMS